MSTVVTFAGNLATAPGLLYTRDGKPFVTCRVLVNRRVRDEAGGWIDGEPTAHNVKVYQSAATYLHDSAGTGDRVMVHGVLKTEGWQDKETGEKRSRTVVEVSNAYGEVGVSLRWMAARIAGRQRPRPAEDGRAGWIWSSIRATS
jgi:single-strand DNA-binding protein